MRQGIYLPYAVSHYSEAAQQAVVAEFSLAKTDIPVQSRTAVSMNTLQSAQLMHRSTLEENK